MSTVIVNHKRCRSPVSRTGVAVPSGCGVGVAVIGRPPQTGRAVPS
jgi:hypothetical protein